MLFRVERMIRTDEEPETELRCDRCGIRFYAGRDGWIDVSHLCGSLDAEYIED